MPVVNKLHRRRLRRDRRLGGVRFRTVQDLYQGTRRIEYEGRCGQHAHDAIAEVVRIARCRPPDVEATRNVIRARAAELGLLESDGLTLRHRAFVAIARQAEAEGRGITRVRVSQAWRDGVVNLAGWTLSATFAVNPDGAKESEKKDTARACAG